MGIFDFFRESSNQQKLKKLYESRGYDEVPFLPPESECSRILENYESFPFSLVPKENMIYIDSKMKLLPGHIVLLWWLKNPRTNKKIVPQYFLFEYGLNFDEQVLFLQANKLLSENKLTDIGERYLSAYSEIIRKHKARKIYNSDGTITYHYEDAESVSGMEKFKSTGDIVEDQFIGKAFERANDLYNAELAYLSAIRLSERESPPPNPFLRLAVIYRKQRKLDKEENILNQALEYYDSLSDNVFRDRLEKLEKIKLKNKKGQDTGFQRN